MAAKYCNWLSKKAGLNPVYKAQGEKMIAIRPLPNGYRLPTEAEWAWVARYAAGKRASSRFPWGDKMPPLAGSGNFADEKASSTLKQTLSAYNDGFAGTAPVGTFRNKSLGINDLAGNVAEWVNDYYGIDPASASKLQVDPLGPVSGQHHVVRGSSWRDASISELRWSYRDYSQKKRPDVGFRIARNAH